jgi:hypothetical protein
MLSIGVGSKIICSGASLTKSQGQLLRLGRQQTAVRSEWSAQEKEAAARACLSRSRKRSQAAQSYNSTGSELLSGRLRMILASTNSHR